MKRNPSKFEREEYAQWCKKHGINPLTHKPQNRRVFTEFSGRAPARVRREDGNKSIRSLDSGTKGAVSTRSIMDPLQWKGESAETVEKILDKSKRIAPHYSKGAAQYITDDMDYSDLGRKK